MERHLWIVVTKQLKLKKANEYAHVAELYLVVILMKAQNGAYMETQKKIPQEAAQLPLNSSQTPPMDL